MERESRLAVIVRTGLASLLLLVALIVRVAIGPPTGTLVILVCAGAWLLLSGLDALIASRGDPGAAWARFGRDAAPLLLAALTLGATLLTPLPLVLLPLLVLVIGLAAVAAEPGPGDAVVVFAGVLTAVLGAGLSPMLRSWDAAMYVLLVEPFGLVPVIVAAAASVTLLVAARRTAAAPRQSGQGSRRAVTMRMAAVLLIVAATVAAVDFTGRTAATASVRAVEQRNAGERAKADEGFVRDVGRYLDKAKAFDRLGKPDTGLAQAVWMQERPEGQVSDWCLFRRPSAEETATRRYGLSDYVFLGAVRTRVLEWWPEDAGAVAGEPQASERGPVSALTDLDESAQKVVALALRTRRDGLILVHDPLKDASFELGLLYEGRTEFFHEYPGGGGGTSGDATVRPPYVMVLLPDTRLSRRAVREETPHDNMLGMSRFVSVLAAAVMLFGCSLGLTVATRRDDRRLLETQAEERARIQQEAHDRVANRLSALALQAEAAASAQAEAGDLMASLPQALRRSVSDLREIVSGAEADALGLRERLEEVCRERAADHSLEVDCIIDLGPAAVFGSTAAEAVVSMLQEALGNVAKHAEARHVRVRVHRREGRRTAYEMAVADDGRGFSPPDDLRVLEEQGHTGLAGIARRARALGGRLEIDAAPGQGTTLRITWTAKDGGG